MSGKGKEHPNAIECFKRTKTGKLTRLQLAGSTKDLNRGLCVRRGLVCAKPPRADFIVAAANVSQIL